MGERKMMSECWCSNCDEWFDTTTVEFLNVEENAYGEDSFTFVCHVCDEKQTSLVRSWRGPDEDWPKKRVAASQANHKWKRR